MVQVNNGTSGEFLIAGNTGYTARRFYIGVGYWDDASPGGTKNLYSAWFSKTRQVAVGEGGLIYRRIYQGLSWQGWTTETSNLTTDLRSVWGASETNIFTVGLNGKILFWDGNGLCLFTKRLQRGRFIWPHITTPGGSVVLSPAQLSMLIEGIDWRFPERTWRPAIAG